MLSTNIVSSAEKSKCDEFKKFSIKYTWCKSKKVGKTVKNKLTSIKKKR